MEQFFKSKKIEVFDSHNRNRVHLVAKPNGGGVILSIDLEQEPITNSVQVLEGAIVMPEQDYKINGKNIQILANSDKPL